MIRTYCRALCLRRTIEKLNNIFYGKTRGREVDIDNKRILLSLVVKRIVQ